MKPQEQKELEEYTKVIFPFETPKSPSDLEDKRLHDHNEMQSDNRSIFIEGALYQAEKSKKKEGEFAEWCSDNGWDYQEKGLWQEHWEPHETKTTAQLYAIFEEERGKV